MATHIEITRAGYTVPVEGALITSATITPTGSNQVTSFSGVPSDSALFVTITGDENIFFVIGTTPDATTVPRRALAAGSTRSFAFAAGQQVAVVTR